MFFTSVFFNFIFYSNNNFTASYVWQLRRDQCINYCSTFFIKALPGVDDAQVIKQSKVALLLVNDTTIMKPLEFHTSISFDFNRKQWLQKDIFSSKSIAKDHWTIDRVYSKKYPVLKDSLGINFDTTNMRVMRIICYDVLKEFCSHSPIILIPMGGPIKKSFSGQIKRLCFHQINA